MSVVTDEQSPGTASSGFNIRFPEARLNLDQNEEWFEFDVNGRSRTLRIHDYADLYRVPGLYEALVYDKLACKSPQRLAQLFAAVLTDWRIGADDLRVLDLGAGNGIAAEEFRKLGVHHFVGLDLLPEALLAADRDRPALYADYLVTDLCSMSENNLTRLEQHGLNCLLTVAALGFDDIPPEAFGTAFNSIARKGWLGMTIKENFLESDDESGFARLIKGMIDQQIIEIQAHQRYCHRLSITGERLCYMTVVARKTRDIPASLLDQVAHRQVTQVNGKTVELTAMLLGG